MRGRQPTARLRDGAVVVLHGWDFEQFPLAGATHPRLDDLAGVVPSVCGATPTRP